VGISILRILLYGEIPEIGPVTTFKMLVATCGDKHNFSSMVFIDVSQKTKFVTQK